VLEGVGALELTMTAPLSRDLRERIIRAVAEGSSIRQAAERFAVSPSAAVKLMQRVRQTGSTSPAKIGGRRRQLLEPYADLLREMVLAKKEITLREIKAVLAARGVEVKALSTIADMFHRLDRSHKKELEGQRAGSARCRPAPQPLAGVAALHGCRTLCVSGRDGGPHRDDAAPRLGAARRAAGRLGALWTLEDNDLCGRPAQ
jgi:transposase